MNRRECDRPDYSLLATALILTFNEEHNIVRTLMSLEWLQNILVIDSGSTDNTLAILSRYSSVTVIYRRFDTFARQCNFGLEHVRTPWVLSLDADYRLSSALVAEIKNILSQSPHAHVAGFSIPFKYCIGGKPLRGSLLPPRICLYRTEQAQYLDEGHGHRVMIRGEIKSLSSPIFHDDRKPISRWLHSQRNYMVVEAVNLSSTSLQELTWPDRLRKQTPFAPFAALFLCLFWKGAILDGRRGWFYALQRMYAELLLLLLLMDLRISPKGGRQGRGQPIEPLL